MVLGLGTVGCDQATKGIAASERPNVALFGGVARLTYAENPGAFLGLGDRLPAGGRVALLVVVNAVLLGALGWWAFRRRQETLVRAAATLVIAGGLGNLIDRVLRDGGRVVDFMVVGVGPVKTGIFNVADVAVMVGVGLLLIAGARRTPAATQD